VSLLSWGGGWGEIEIKAKLIPAIAGVWDELGKNAVNSIRQRTKAAPTNGYPSNAMLSSMKV
jgi:hypothetical protein